MTEIEPIELGRLRVIQLIFNKVTDGQLGYLAGFIDADGGFSLIIRRERGKLEFSPRLSIGNTDPRLFKYFRTLGIESLIPKPFTRQRKDGYKRKPFYQITLAQNDMRIVLPKILKFLVLKRDRAELTLEALDLLKTKKTKERDRRLTEISEKIKYLNQRTIPPEWEESEG